MEYWSGASDKIMAAVLEKLPKETEILPLHWAGPFLHGDPIGEGYNKAITDMRWELTGGD